MEETLPRVERPVTERVELALRVVNFPVEAVELPMAILSRVEVEMPPEGVNNPVEVKLVKLPAALVVPPMIMLSRVEVEREP